MVLLPKHKSLILPGVLPDGTPRTLIDVPVDKYFKFDQRRGCTADLSLDDLAMAARTQNNTPGVGVFQLDRIDNESGEVVSRVIAHNVILDTMINNMLKLYGSAGASSTLAQYFAIDTATATAQQSGGTINTGSGAQTTIAVVSGGAASWVSGNASSSYLANASNTGIKQNNSAPGLLPDPVYGTGIIWSYGITANVEYVAGTTGASSAASINITSYTVIGGRSHVAGDWVVAGPSVGDALAASPTGAVMSTAIAGSATTTSGVGNRKMQLQFTYSTSTAAGAYTGIWAASNSTTGAWGVATTMSHVVTSPQQINATTSLQITYNAIF